MLTISHLTKTFGGKTAVDDLSLHIAPGEICGFIGHNGAGKTTTIKACCGILTPDSGSIEIAGTSVAQDPIACKKSLAYIPDNPDLYEFLSGIQYLNFVADIYGVSQADRQRRIHQYAALFDLTDEQICIEILTSGLRGRGGGGFPTGKKWDSVRRQPSGEKYVVCNGDEGDPGAFMDRSIMEGNPHSVIEGMMIAAIAVGAQKGYIYVRAEYPLAVERLQTAIDQARDVGLLGENILGTEFSFDIRINRGAGAFVCGEGSALTASIEGNRGMPRTKPPRTVEKGLWAKPTVLNNVETFANIPYIINEGANAYRAIGNATSPGTKAFALAGNIRHTGLIEVPMGTTLREIIFDIGGGIKDGKKFKAVQIGGPSGGCLTEEHLDLPLDYDSLKHVGAIMGSGGLVVMDEDTCMAEVARFFMKFTQKESCGKCIPCREGTKRMLEALERIVGNEGSEEDIELLEELSDTISHTALCGLGQSACKPVQSTLRYFREDYERHVRDKFCPLCNGKPKVLQIDPEKCKGCSLCARNCPVEAITGEVKKPFVIDTEKCIRCNACVRNCKFGAIREV